MADEAESYYELWERVYGAEIFHYAILMTFYCGHTLSWTLTTAQSKPKASDEKRLVTESMLENAVGEAEKGTVASGSDEDKATVSASISHVDEASNVGSVASSDDPEANDGLVGKHSQSTDVSKAVSFRDEVSEINV